MNVRRMLTVRFCLSLGLAVSIASVLAAQRSGHEAAIEGEGVVYVYFPSLCAAPGDGSDCQEIKRPSRPSFESMAACSAYADVELQREHNPRLMASCMKVREG